MYISRANYDKMHRCPGWSGGGWIGVRRERCGETGGYITFGMTHEQYGNLDYDGKAFRKYPRAWHFGQCTECDVLVLPHSTRWLDPTWYRWWIPSRISIIKYRFFG